MENEYNALREELLKRIENRQTTISLAITVAGAMLGFSVQTRSIALLYPVLALFFCCHWAQNELRELQLCDYLHLLEKKLDYGWSNYYKTIQAQGTFVRGIPISVVVPGMLFELTSAVSILMARQILFTSLFHGIATVADIISVVLILIVVIKVRNERLSRRAGSK